MAYTIGEPTAQQFIDDNGDPAVGHVLYFYIKGTTTPTSIAFDTAGASTATSVTIGADGFPENGGSSVAVYYNTTVTYDIVRKDSGGTAYGPTIESYSSSPAAAFTRRTVTASETYTPSAKVKSIEFELIGGGGGSGGCSTTGGAQVSSGGGGGGGGYVRHTTSTIAASYTITIGAGGTGGVAGDNDGTAGGDTIVTDGASFTLTASGGGLGQGAAAAENATGGAGGAATGGTINYAGSDGGRSLGAAIPIASTLANTYGGDSYVQRGTDGPAANSVGVAGVDYGGGASGPYNSISQSARAGADGGDGVLILTEYL